MKQIADLFVRRGTLLGGNRYAFSSFGKYHFLKELGLA